MDLALHTGIDYDPLETASEYHEGQWTALYSLSSTGSIHHPPHEYMRELEDWRHEDDAFDLYTLFVELDRVWESAVHFIESGGMPDIPEIRWWHPFANQSLLVWQEFVNYILDNMDEVF